MSASYGKFVPKRWRGDSTHRQNDHKFDLHFNMKMDNQSKRGYLQTGKLGKFYVPLSLGNPKFNRSSMGDLRDLLKNHEASSTIVLFDSLRVLTNLIRGDDYRSALEKADETSRSTESMLRSIFSSAEMPWEILRSSTLKQNSDIILIEKEVEEYLKKNPNAYKFMGELTGKVLQRMNVLYTPYRGYLEQLYLIEETAISLYFIGNPEVIAEVYVKKENGLIDYIFEHTDFFEMQELLVNGRKFMSWNELKSKVNKCK